MVGLGDVLKVKLDLESLFSAIWSLFQVYYAGILVNRKAVDTVPMVNELYRGNSIKLYTSSGRYRSFV